jgi:hypothetical protein
MRYITITLLLLTVPADSLSQSIKTSPYKFSADIDKQIMTDSFYWRGGVAASDLSFTGLYQRALEEWDKARPGKRNISARDSAAFMETYKPADASKFILEKAKQTRVVIFNEAHYYPRHRVFVASMLGRLKKLGYTHFAAEAFSTDEDFAVSSRIPDLATGFYTSEPQFGNLIREANKLSYKLFPYETELEGGINVREEDQARKLAALLNSDPSIKVVILCGFDHVMEDSIRNWGLPMAARVKQLTGIDPLTIDQIMLSERFVSSLNSPYFNLINSEDYAVMVDKNGGVFNKRPDGKKVDILLYAPPTKYIHNRPSWIFSNNRKPALLKRSTVKVSFPVLAKVYHSEEDIRKQVIPVDVIEIANEEALWTTAFSVEGGKKWLVQLTDRNGGEQVLWR